MSAIRQDVRGRKRELKNSCADAAASTLYPSDLMRPFIASRTGSSSSMTEISGFAFDTRPPAPGLVLAIMRRAPRRLGAGRYSRQFRKDEIKAGVRRLYFGLDRMVARANISCDIPCSVSRDTRVEPSAGAREPSMVTARQIALIALPCLSVRF